MKYLLAHLFIGITFCASSSNFRCGIKFDLVSRTGISDSINGKSLADSTPLFQNPQIGSLSILAVHLRFNGGGGGGGATGAESRDCYLNMYAVKKPDKVDPNEMQLSKWLNCNLSNEQLKHPVIIDKLGNLFNKEALVEALLKKNLPKEFRYIKGLKDMIAVELVEFTESDKIVINGNEEEVKALREKLEEQARLKDNNKKSKKVKNGDANAEVGRLVGTKHGVNGNVYNHNNNGSAKRFKAADIAPANATKEVYASIFTSSKKSDFKETYSCKSLPLGRN